MSRGSPTRGSHIYFVIYEWDPVAGIAKGIASTWSKNGTFVTTSGSWATNCTPSRIVVNITPSWLCNSVIQIYVSGPATSAKSTQVQADNREKQAACT